MPKEYPLFIIDRNRRSRDENHQFDYLVCLDKEVGFVGKVVLFGRNAFDEFNDKKASIDGVDYMNYSCLFKSGEAGVVLFIVDFLYDFDLNSRTTGRLRSLLKKGMKKYLHAEIATVPDSDNLSLDNQIKVLEDVLKDIKAGYAKMVVHMGEKNAQFYTACVEKSIESIRLLSKITN